MIAVGMLIAMAVAQFVGVWQLARHVARSRTANERLAAETADQPLPKVAILLSLRGADPDLFDGLVALGHQDHDNYEVVVVVDHELDPSLAVARRAAEALPPGRLRVDVIRQRSTQCGLKCCALAQAYRSLDSDVKIIALVDADIVVHPTWLRRLVAPLSDERVGVVTGAQWFEPEDGDTGTWIRSIWNAGASVPTIMLGHPWAGSCALRTADVDATRLVERWERSIIDDGPIAAVAHEMKREVRFVPDAWMINREHCSRKFVVPYLTRMLTWSRLYESTYPITVGHAVGTLALWGIAWYTVWRGLVLGDVSLILFGLLPALLFWIAAAAAFWLVRGVLRREARRRDIVVRRKGFLDMVRVVVLLPVTYLIYAWSSLAALTVRRVLWRGVEYRLDGGVVRMTHYEPYRAAPPGTRSSVGTPTIHLSQDRFARAGVGVFFLGLAIQLTLLSQMTWSPRYAAVIAPSQLNHQHYTSAVRDPGGDSSPTTPNTNTGDPPSDIDPAGTHESVAPDPPPNTSPETWNEVDRFAERVDSVMNQIADFRGVLVKQERLFGKLEPLVTLEFRQLSTPLCIHVRWTDVNQGREVLFRVEEDDSETMIARQETVLGALVPTVSLSKDHPFTRTLSNHPIDELSMEYLREQMLRYVRHARRNPESIVQLVNEVPLDARTCQRLTIVHPRQTELAPKGYHRVDMYFDMETGYPLRWEKYDWPGSEGADEADPQNPTSIPPLLEYYEVKQFEANLGQTLDDFRNDNPEFGFGRAPIVPLD